MAEPRTVVVTGTSTGIGRATVEVLVEDGFHVIATVRTEAPGTPSRRITRQTASASSLRRWSASTIRGTAFSSTTVLP